jgi:hypothetical protein
MSRLKFDSEADFPDNNKLFLICRRQVSSGAGDGNQNIKLGYPCESVYELAGVDLYRNENQ